MQIVSAIVLTLIGDAAQNDLLAKKLLYPYHI